jgi:hypothetical protein
MFSDLQNQSEKLSDILRAYSPLVSATRATCQIRFEYLKEMREGRDLGYRLLPGAYTIF